MSDSICSQINDAIDKLIVCVFFCGALGDSSKQVHMEGYAVSGQCMALVRDNCLVPTKDAPELGYIRESSDKQFVPDVYYKVSTILIYLFSTLHDSIPIFHLNLHLNPTKQQQKIGRKTQISLELLLHFY